MIARRGQYTRSQLGSLPAQTLMVFIINTMSHKMRQVIFILVSQLFMDIPVICFEEVSLDYKLNILGKI